MYNPAANPIQDSHEYRFWDVQTDYYPLYMINYYLGKREQHIMAKKGTRNRKQIKKGEYTFVRMSLTADEKKECAAWFEKSAETLDRKLQDVIESGHKISFSFNETNQNVTCTFTGKPDESVNEYRMLTSFASSWWQALATNLWKNEVYFQDGVWEDAENDEEFG